MMFDGKIRSGALQIIDKLKSAGGQAYLVGGSLRDLLLGKQPGEWDIATDIKPERVTALFDKVVPTGIAFGTVTVILPDGHYEVTTFRSDEKYLDGRHPSNVVFTSDLHRDLARRDFTMNALAFAPSDDQLVDDFSGRQDIGKKLIRAVGQPLERFSEDGLRPVRACRFAAQLDFQIEGETFAAIPKTLNVIKKVAPERIHDELVKILAAGQPSIAFDLMQRSGLLDLVLPELTSCLKVEQPPEFHPWDVFWHSLYSCDAAPKDDYVVRLAALLHDLGKPSCKVEMTFYNHDKVGLDLAKQALKRLKFSNDDVDRTINLIGNHMFDYSSEWSDAAVRRFLRRIGGVSVVPTLFALRRADAKAMHQQAVGTEYLGELQSRIDRIIADENALHVNNLKVDGQDVMAVLKIAPGPRVGQVLNSLLEKVLDEPKLNERETLLEMIKHSV